MTTETSNARGEWVDWMRDREQVVGLADHLEQVGWRQDERGDMQCFDQGAAMAADVIRFVLLPMLDAPPPAAARGDVRGLELSDVITQVRFECRCGGTNACMYCEWADRIESALAADGVQAGEVEERDREADRARFTDPDFNAWLDTGISDAGHTVWDAVGDTQAAWAGWEARQFAGDAVLISECCGREECGGECGNEWRGMTMCRKPAEALSQQPEARGVVDELRRAVASVGVVGSYFGKDTILRGSVLGLIDRRIAALAQQPEARGVVDGVALIEAERRRQVEAEGWTPEHDDEHGDGAMAHAAACYAYGAPFVAGVTVWPWSADWWKPTDRIRDLTKAGALIAAEIDRLQRAALTEARNG